MSRSPAPSALGVFGLWGRFVGRHPIAVILAALLVSAILGAQLPRLRFDTSFESFLAPDHPTRTTLDRFRDQFGRDEPILVAVRVPGRLGDPDFLRALTALHDDLESEVLHLERITSLVNVRATRTEGDELTIGELLASPPSDDAERRALERFVETRPLYRNYMIGTPSDPAARPSWTALVLEANQYATAEAETGSAIGGFDDEPSAGTIAPPGRRLDSRDDTEMVESVRRVLERHRANGLEIRLAGSLVVGEVVGSAIRGDFGRLLGLAAIAVIALLFAIFRRVALSLVVFAVVLLALVGSLGVMALVGAPIGFATQILPAFLLAAGVGYGVHVVTLFRHHLGEAPTACEVPDRADRARAVTATLDHSGLPIVLTAATTIGGLASFVTAELAPIVQLGRFAPVGIALATLYSLVLLPALLVALPLHPRSQADQPGPGLAERLVLRIGLSAARHPRRVLIGVVGVAGFALLGVLQLETRHDPLRWLPADAPVRQATEHVDRTLGGASVLELFLEAATPGAFRDPAVLHRLDRLQADIEALESRPIHVGKVTGLHNVVKEINQSLHGDRPEAYRIPDDPELVAQELILFETSGLDDVAELVDPSYSTARLSIRVNHRDAFDAIPFAGEVERLARSHLEGHARVDMTGLYELKNAVFVSVIDSLARSYQIALIVIGLLIVVLVGDVRIGLASLVPNTLPILVAMGAMGWLGIPLGVYTLMVGSIALGLAVDDTIHMAHGYVRFSRAGHGPTEALRRALSTAGLAVLFTSGALICGFLVFGLATLSALLHFGLVTAVAIAAALVADLVVSPALFVAIDRRRGRRTADFPQAPTLAPTVWRSRVEPEGHA